MKKLLLTNGLLDEKSSSWKRVNPVIEVENSEEIELRAEGKNSLSFELRERSSLRLFLRGKGNKCQSDLHFELKKGASLEIVNENSFKTAEEHFYFGLKEGTFLSLCDLAFCEGKKSFKVDLIEEGASVLLGGKFSLSNERVEVFSEINHLASKTHSNQLFKGTLDKQSKASFVVKGFIGSGVEGADLCQLTKGLLLDNRASMKVAPQLSIFSYLAKASHGAAVAHLRAEDLFYLRSRGILCPQAKELYLEGYMKEFIEFFSKQKNIVRNK